LALLDKLKKELAERRGNPQEARMVVEVGSSQVRHDVMLHEFAKSSEPLCVRLVEGSTIEYLRVSVWLPRLIDPYPESSNDGWQGGSRRWSSPRTVLRIQ
jgi:hypothetical protein